MELVLVAPDSDANLLPLRYGVLEVLYKTAEKTLSKSEMSQPTREAGGPSLRRHPTPGDSAIAASPMAPKPTGHKRIGNLANCDVGIPSGAIGQLRIGIGSP